MFATSLIVPAGDSVLPEASLSEQPRQDHGARFSSRSPLLALCAGSLRLGFWLLTHGGRSLVIRLPCRHGDLKECGKANTPQVFQTKEGALAARRIDDRN